MHSRLLSSGSGQHTPMRKPKAIDLFCGAGGLTEGLRQAGYRVVGAVEIDADACATYRVNHGRIKLWQTDIRRVTGPSMMRALKLQRGDLDLLAACPPCQGFSSMRTRNGARRIRDERNDLIYDVLRIVRSMRPKSVMLENVPGLATDRRYAAFCTALEAMGYFVKWAIFNTVDFGVPQRRRRLVMVASTIADPQFASRATRRRTVREFIGSIAPPDKSRDPLHNYSVRRSSKSLQKIKDIPLDGGSRSDLGKDRQLRCHKRIRGFFDVYGRMAWDGPSPTITGGCLNPSKGRFLHPQAHRAITLREAALLQTFPRTYRFRMERGRYAVALLIGNALPPEFIRRHAVALRNALAAVG